MFAKKVALSLVAGTVAMSLPAFSQEETSVYKNEASVQAFGSFVKTTTSNGDDESATNSGGVLASYRFFFTQHQGVEALWLRPQHSELRAHRRICRGEDELA